jgi:hypothetical protein
MRLPYAIVCQGGGKRSCYLSIEIIEETKVVTHSIAVANDELLEDDIIRALQSAEIVWIKLF